MFLVVSGIPNLFKNLLASLPKILGVSRNDPGHDLKSQLFDENFIPHDKFWAEVKSTYNP